MSPSRRRAGAFPGAPRQASTGPATAAAAVTPPAPAPPGADGSPSSEHLRAEVARAQLLARFSHAANLSVPDVDGLLPLVAEGVSDLLGDACAISLVSDDGRWIDLAALHGRDPGLMEAAAEVLTSSRTRIDEGTDGQVVASGRTYFRPTVGASELRQELKAEYRPLLDLARVDSIITVPLVARGRVVGTMTAARLHAGAPYTDADRAFLEELADRAAVAIDNARLYAGRVAAEESRRASEQRLRRAVGVAEARAAQQAAVVELGRRALSRVDLDELMASAVRAVTECLRTDYASVLQLRPGGAELVVRAGDGWTDGVVGATTVPAGRGSHAGYTVLVGEPVIVEDLAVEARFSAPPLLVAHRVVSGASVVVSLEGEPFGVLATHCRRPRSFAVEEVDFLQSVANVVATAIVRQRHDELQEYARHQDRLAAIGRFAAGMAHDFNNLVTVIRLHAELLGSRPGLDTGSLEVLNHIRGEAEQAASLVWQILDFAHRDPIARVAVDCDAFCERMLAVMRRLCPSGVLVSLRSDSAGHVVLGDEGRLEQVVMNLTTNARDAMGAGGRLDVGLARVEVDDGLATPLPGLARGPWVRLEVSDTGAGIPAGLLPRVFEPFFSTKAPGRGTGLGLAQVYGLVLQHEGRVDIRSVVGEGTTVTVWLPAAPPGPYGPPSRPGG